MPVSYSLADRPAGYEVIRELLLGTAWISTTG